MRRLVASVVVVAAACGGGADARIAAGTTLVDSGVVAAIGDAFAVESGIELSVVAGSSAEGLELAARGEVVAAITHHPALEVSFLARHPEAVAVPLFESRFALAGPAARAARLDGLSVVAAFAEIARNDWGFVSRADGSGTFAREQALWQEAGVDPADRDWFVATGQGMGATLQVADQRDAFVLVEVGTFSRAEGIDLVLVATADPPAVLANPYTLVVPDPASNVARRLLAWAGTSGPASAAQAFSLEEFGEPVYSAP